MIKIEHVDVVGLEPAIRGMRNPMNSWEKSDSGIGCPRGTCEECDIKPEYCEHFIQYGAGYAAGPNDLKLMKKLAKGGPVHAKYRRMIAVYMDITAPLYWWKEFDTYKVGTVANSCSTMHKIHEKEFTFDDFSCEHLIGPEDVRIGDMNYMIVINYVVEVLNVARKKYLETNDKKYWWQMIQLLPSSYNQKRTIMLNYEVLVGIYKYRKDHKLDEWREFCKWIETLPYSELITGTLYDEENISKSKSKLITEMSAVEFFEDFRNQRDVLTLEEYLYKKMYEAANAKKEDEKND